jgi:hypothetical protein
MSMSMETLGLVLRVVRTLTEQMTPDQVEAAATDLREQAEHSSANSSEREFLQEIADGMTTIAAKLRGALAD